MPGGPPDAVGALVPGGGRRLDGPARRYAHEVSAAPTVLVMAAGHGTRMASATPKVLHPICGRPMVEWVIDAASRAGAERVVCVVRPGAGVGERLPESVEAVEQREGEGTAAAVLAARGHLEQAETVLVLSGDHPLITSSVIAELIEAHRAADAAATLLSTEALDPVGYGRVVRGEGGQVERVVETKAPEGVDPSDLAIREINLGAYAFSGPELLSALAEVAAGPEGERFLPAALPVLRGRGRPVAAHRTTDVSAATGVNTRVGLMEVEAQARRRLLEAHALGGVTFTAPECVEVDAGVEIGPDTTVGIGVSLKGATRIGSGCRIGPHTTMVSARLEDEVTVIQSHLVECEVASGASVGPFAYLRPGARLEEGSKVGTFVEVKNSSIGAGAKVPHLSYVGDAEVGEGANVAAGNITANYDGREKHRTVIGRGARTGVNSSLVAPVRVGDNAYTGAGSVITEDVPDGALGISRPEQRNVEGYADRVERRPGG